MRHVKPHRFDLEQAISNWKAPFSVRHFYSGDDVSELEWHLRDALEDEMAEGLSEQEAFWLAVSRVGDESLLRSQYRQSWKETNPFKRYWRRLRAELSGLNTRTGRSMYVLARLYSFTVGGFASILLVAVPIWLLQGVPFWSPGQPLSHQGWVFTFSLGLLAFFNLIPFERWQNSIANWLRLGYSTWLFVTFTILLLNDTAAVSTEIVAQISISLSILLGPTLWLRQLFSRRDVPVPFAEQLHELEAGA